jgi:hypothetical protein
LTNDHLLETRLALQGASHPFPGYGYWYMAGPYSDSIEERYKQHLDAVAILTRTNLTIYSPIIHYHTIAQIYNMPTDAAFWYEHNRNMLLSSRGLILLCLTNWSDSKGVRDELNLCREKSISVWALDPPTYEGTEVSLIWTKML